jgi:hypothetical protein
MNPKSNDGGGVARAWGNALVPRVLALFAGVYFVAVGLEAYKPGVTARVLPSVLVYFSQIASLFPHASTVAIEYRAEGWLCKEQRFVEIDVRPYFPIEADDKESRFQRAMFFYREHRQALQSLEAYVMGRYNRDAIEAAAEGLGKSAEPIAGVRFLSLRVPFGKAGEPAERYQRKPLEAYPEEMRKEWYWTPISKREERCGKTSR